MSQLSCHYYNYYYFESISVVLTPMPTTLLHLVKCQYFCTNQRFSIFSFFKSLNLVRLIKVPSFELHGLLQSVFEGKIAHFVGKMREKALF